MSSPPHDPPTHAGRQLQVPAGATDLWSARPSPWRESKSTPGWKSSSHSHPHRGGQARSEQQQPRLDPAQPADPGFQLLGSTHALWATMQPANKNIMRSAELTWGCLLATVSLATDEKLTGGSAKKQFVC